MFFAQVELAQLLNESDDDTILEHVLPKKNQAPDSITRLVSGPHGSNRSLSLNRPLRHVCTEYSGAEKQQHAGGGC